jgi:acyl-CoA synthetase (AMP-forming)/AMP-acid ligase II
MYTPSFSDIHGGIEFGINKKAWDSLDKDLQLLIKTATEAEIDRIHADNLFASITALEKIEGMKEVTIGEFPELVWDAWRKAAKEVMEEARAQSKTVAKVQDSFYAFAKKASSYRMLYDKRLLANIRSRHPSATVCPCFMSMGSVLPFTLPWWRDPARSCWIDYITDRIKHIIISGGENISAKEVETVINLLEGVVESAVVDLPDIKWGEQVVAAVLCKPEAGLTPEKVRAHCNQHLHQWKSPQKIIFVDQIPKNTMGKILKDEVKKLFSLKKIR